MQIKTIGFSIAYILASVLGLLGFSNINESNIENYVSKDSESVSNFIEKNLTKFVETFNENVEEADQWKATSVEGRKTVLDINTDETYVYLDFNEDNGYALVGNDYDFMDFSTSGDLDYLKNEEELLWSSYDGFVYRIDDDYVRYNTNFFTEEDLEEIAYGYNGKVDGYESGSDVIKDIPAYMQSRYGSGWYYGGGKSLNNYVDVYQNDYAIYNNGEGNCTLSAFYGIFQYLRDYGNFTNLPYGYVTVDTSKDSFAKDNRVTNNSVPVIYATIRECAMKYGYTTESNAKTSIFMDEWGNKALEKLGYKSNWFRVYMKMKLVWSFQGEVVNNINSGYPVMWNQARGNYGNHSMVVKGYKNYKKNHKLWFIKWTETIHFMEISDNWKHTGNTTYIDFDGYSSDLIREGFGTFVVIKDYKW